MQIIARSIKRFFFLKKMLREFIFFIFLPIVPRSLFTYEYIFYDKFNFLFSHLQKTTIFTDIGILRRVGKHFSFLACFPSTLLKQSPCSLSLCPSGRFPDARIQQRLPIWLVQLLSCFLNKQQQALSSLFGGKLCLSLCPHFVGLTTLQQ